MERAVRSGERRAYATAVADLWGRLGSALARLERVAELPVERIGVEARDELPSLQYSLHASHPDVGVAIFSGSIQRPEEAAEFAHGYLPKPFTLEQLSETVRRLVAGR